MKLIRLTLKILSAFLAALWDIGAMLPPSISNSSHFDMLDAVELPTKTPNTKYLRRLLGLISL